jgi:hypothetical protein
MRLRELEVLEKVSEKAKLAVVPGEKGLADRRQAAVGGSNEGSGNRAAAPRDQDANHSTLSAHPNREHVHRREWRVRPRQPFAPERGAIGGRTEPGAGAVA